MDPRALITGSAAKLLLYRHIFKSSFSELGRFSEA
jgi:hypothetical protein